MRTFRYTPTPFCYSQTPFCTSAVVPGQLSSHFLKIVLLSLCMHLISKWRQYHFPFIFTLISPLCLDYICKIKCYLETTSSSNCYNSKRTTKFVAILEQGVLKLSNLQCAFRHCRCNHPTFFNAG